jgi:hypothetical protein
MNKYLKYKHKYLSMKQKGGNKYKFFLNNLIKKIFEDGVLEITNCEPFNDEYMNILQKIDGGSNKILLIDIIKNYHNDYIFLNECDKVIIKIIDSDKLEIYDLKNEITALSYLSLLVVNNITSNFLIFLGLTTNCELMFDSEFIDSGTNTILFTNYIEGKSFDNLIKENQHFKLNDRQIFEYLYSTICSFAYYNTFTGDLNYGNIMIFDDKLYTHITIKFLSKSLFFPSYKSICSIDCELDDKFMLDSCNNETKYNISDYKSKITNFIEDPTMKQKIKKMSSTGTYIELLTELVGIFDNYVYSDVDLPKNSRYLIFDL